MLIMVLFGRGDFMFQKKINGAWSNIETVKRKTGGTWTNCSIVQKKFNGVWSIVWLKQLNFTSNSSYATINPPTITKLDIPSTYWSSHQTYSASMSATYFANAGSTISIKYKTNFSHGTTSNLTTRSELIITGTTFSNKFSYKLANGINSSSQGGTFTTTAKTTGQGVVTVTVEHENPSNGGGSTNYGKAGIGDIIIDGIQVYTSSLGSI